jgi:hypothetical protein
MLHALGFDTRAVMLPANSGFPSTSLRAGSHFVRDGKASRV